jgi:hypothetical protein
LHSTGERQPSAATHPATHRLPWARR